MCQKENTMRQLWFAMITPAVVALAVVTSSVSPAAAGPTDSTSSDSARINIHVPPHARVFFDGAPTRQPGEFRQFVSPPLEPNRTYSYEIRAAWTENGGTVEERRKLEIRRGQELKIDFLAERATEQKIRDAEEIKAPPPTRPPVPESPLRQPAPEKLEERKSSAATADTSVAGVFKGNGREAKLAFASATKGEPFGGEETIVLVFTEQDHSKEKKPQTKAGFGDFGSALIVTVTPEGKVVGCEVAHAAHTKGTFSAIGDIKSSDFKIADGKIQGKLATDGEVKTFGQTWEVNIKFQTPAP
jgi:uncharacterized protein (TIGR03000 family)